MRSATAGVLPLCPSLPALHAGIDEAGRGCLAGPVIAAAVILPPDCRIPGLGDSKQLSPAKRAALVPRIREEAWAWALGAAWPKEIDSLNILNATFLAMTRAVKCLGCSPFPPLAVDGNHPIRATAWRAILGDAPMPRQQAIIKGDSLVPSISAASILAKEFRDQLMTRLDLRHPGYGFALHKGYGTAAHLKALHELGPCSAHRHSFRRVRPEEEQVALFPST